MIYVNDRSKYDYLIHIARSFLTVLLEGLEHTKSSKIRRMILEKTGIKFQVPRDRKLRVLLCTLFIVMFNKPNLEHTSRRCHL